MNKTELAEECKRILHGTPVGQSLSGADLQFVRRLIANHPRANEKIGCGICRIEIRRNSQYGANKQSVGFWIVRNDGTETDFSYKKCVTPEKSASRSFIAACRGEVRDHIEDFRNRFFRTATSPTCCITGVPITPKDSHVDHSPPYTFERIVSAFVELNNIDLDDESLCKKGDGQDTAELSCQILRDRWVVFHNSYASLRVISTHANTSIVPKSHRNESLFRERKSA